MAGSRTSERGGRRDGGGKEPDRQSDGEARPPEDGRASPRARGEQPAARRTRADVLRRRRRLLAVGTALAVLAGGGAWLVYGSPLFDVTRVEVSGTRALTADDVRRAAGVPLGGSLAGVDTSSIEHRLTKALPRIGRVTAERSWPHTVRLDVTERTTAAVTQEGSRFMEVDRAGVRFAAVSSPPKGAPLVKVVKAAQPNPPGSVAFSTTRLLRAAVEVATHLPEPVRTRTDAVEVRTYDDIRLELSGGRTVVWGSAEQLTRKGKVLTALLKAVPHAHRYDVSSPSTPATGS